MCKMASDKTKSTKTSSKTKVTSAKKFSKETYMYWFESMLLQRRFEEKCGQLYGQQKIKGFCKKSKIKITKELFIKYLYETQNNFNFNTLF